MIRLFLAGSTSIVFAGACAPAGEVAPAGAPPEVETPAPLRAVRAGRAEESAWERTLRVPAELAASEEATVAAKVPGRVQEIMVDLGSRVRRGDVVAQIESREYELGVARAEAALEVVRWALGPPIDGEDAAIDPAVTANVRRAQADLDEARREHERLLELSNRGISAQAEPDRAQTRLRSAESAMQDALEKVQVQRALVAQRRVEPEMARQELANARILAPFDGAVVERLVGTGDYVSSGDGVARIVRDDPVRLQMEVGELEAMAVAVGQQVRAWLEGAKGPVTGTVSRIAPVIDGRSRTLSLEVDLPNQVGELRPGSFARADIVVDPLARTLVIPLAALATFAGVDKVFVIEDGHAVERRVVVGRREAERVEILSGLESGAEVVLSPGSPRTGDPVSVEP